MLKRELKTTGRAGFGKTYNAAITYIRRSHPEFNGRVHFLKTWRQAFYLTCEGRKTADLRKGDRGFKQWDYVVLEEYERATYTFLGAFAIAQITDVQTASDWPALLQPGVVQLSLGLRVRSWDPEFLGVSDDGAGPL